MRDAKEIVIYPDKRLRKKCIKVEKFDDALKEKIDRMFYLMRKYNGVGLAANQAGFSECMFVCNATGKPEDDMVFINPEIIEVKEHDEIIEGCLSLPFVQVLHHRFKFCKISSQKLNGEPFTLDADGILSKIVQHECDHIFGKLIIDKMKITESIINKGIIQRLIMSDMEIKEREDNENS